MPKTTLVWTKEKPTQPGWYWVKFPETEEYPAETLCLEVKVTLEGPQFREFATGPDEIEYWMGPIPVPSPPVEIP